MVLRFRTKLWFSSKVMLEDCHPARCIHSFWRHTYHKIISTLDAMSYNLRYLPHVIIIFWPPNSDAGFRPEDGLVLQQ
jgi:hypothetical protein